MSCITLNEEWDQDCLCVVDWLLDVIEVYRGISLDRSVYGLPLYIIGRDDIIGSTAKNALETLTFILLSTNVGEAVERLGLDEVPARSRAAGFPLAKLGVERALEDIGFRQLPHSTTLDFLNSEVKVQDTLTALSLMAALESKHL